MIFSLLRPPVRLGKRCGGSTATKYLGSDCLLVVAVRSPSTFNSDLNQGQGVSRCVSDFPLGLEFFHGTGPPINAQAEREPCPNELWAGLRRTVGIPTTTAESRSLGSHNVVDFSLQCVAAVGVPDSDGQMRMLRAPQRAQQASRRMGQTTCRARTCQAQESVCVVVIRVRFPSQAAMLFQLEPNLPSTKGTSRSLPREYSLCLSFLAPLSCVPDVFTSRAVVHAPARQRTDPRSFFNRARYAGRRQTLAKKWLVCRWSLVEERHR